MNIFKKIKKTLTQWKYRNDYTSVYNDLEFIWGVKSYDDLTGGEPSIYSMNDIDVIYTIEEKKYLISVETIYSWNEDWLGEKEKAYYKRLLSLFTEWMISKGYDTNKEISMANILSYGYSMNTKFDTIEEGYAYFKFYVEGFCK